jgi:hypothetical protein
MCLPVQVRSSVWRRLLSSYVCALNYQYRPHQRMIHLQSMEMDLASLILIACCLPVSASAPVYGIALLGFNFTFDPGPKHRCEVNRESEETEGVRRSTNQMRNTSQQEEEEEEEEEEGWLAPAPRDSELGLPLKID